MVLIVPNMCKYICDQNVIVVQRFKINVRIFVVSLLRCLDVLSNKYIRLICEISSLLFRMIPYNMCTGRASCAHVWTQAIDPNNGSSLFQWVSRCPHQGWVSFSFWGSWSLPMQRPSNWQQPVLEESRWTVTSTRCSTVLITWKSIEV